MSKIEVIELIDKIKRLEMINKKLDEVMEGVVYGTIPNYQITFRGKTRSGDTFESDFIPFGTPKTIIKFIGDEIEENQRNIDKMIDNIRYGYKTPGNFPYNHWLNDFEVAMVEKALNIQLYPWQKEFLKGSNRVDLNNGSGKTFVFTLAYTLRLIAFEMFIDYDNDVHRCLLSPVYSDTEKYIGEMFIDFWEKLSVYPFELNTKLELTKDWWGIKWDK